MISNDDNLLRLLWAKYSLLRSRQNIMPLMGGRPGQAQIARHDQRAVRMRWRLERELLSQ